MRSRLKKMFPVSWKDLGITIGILLVASALCLPLKIVSENDFHVPLIFLLAVLFISFFTNGYLFGMASAVVSLFLVNIAFTYPYMKLDFSFTGYPLTFICMFVGSIIGCTMATSMKESRELKVKAEREGMRANLLRTVSHDFRTPLTSIIGAMELIRDRGDALSEEETTGLIDGAKSEAEWLINMVENLLSVTRIGDDPKANIHKEPQAAEEIVAESIEHFRKHYPDYEIEVRMPEEILFVDADALLIEQVLNNILINAALHAKNATKITLTVQKQQPFVVFQIDDNGSGFTKEELLHAFDDYVLRGGNDDHNTTRGMGIGLSVCNTIIRAHNGKLKVQNLESGGASVVFSLPLSEVKDGTEIEDIDR